VSILNEIRRASNIRISEHITALVDIFAKLVAENPNDRGAQDGLRSATYWLEDVNKELNQ
jgi:hypothetical protein